MAYRYKPTWSKVYYHVTTRTAQQVYWLENEPEIKAYWVDLLKFYSKVFYVEVFSYTLLSNHFHLCVCVRRPDFDLADVKRRFEISQTRVALPRKFQPETALYHFHRFCDLSQFMKMLNWRLATHYNKLKGTSGHFWGAPFKSKVIDQKDYLLNTMTYIALNSIRAGLVERPELFRYSSAAEIYRLIEKKSYDPTPRVGFLKNLPDFKRGQTYIHFLNSVSQAIRNGKGHLSATNSFLEELVGREGFQDILYTINHSIISDWSADTISQSLERRSRPMAPS